MKYKLFHVVVLAQLISLDFPGLVTVGQVFIPTLICLDTKVNHVLETGKVRH